MTNQHKFYFNSLYGIGMSDVTAVEKLLHSDDVSNTGSESSQNSKDTESSLSQASLSNLPDVPLRQIFRHLSDLDIYNLGQIGSPNIRRIANDYVQLGKQ